MNRSFFPKWMSSNISDRSKASFPVSKLPFKFDDENKSRNFRFSIVVKLRWRAGEPRCLLRIREQSINKLHAHSVSHSWEYYLSITLEFLVVRKRCILLRSKVGENNPLPRDRAAFS